MYFFVNHFIGLIKVSLDLCIKKPIFELFFEILHIKLYLHTHNIV